MPDISAGEAPAPATARGAPVPAPDTTSPSPSDGADASEPIAVLEAVPWRDAAPRPDSGVARDPLADAPADTGPADTAPTVDTAIEPDPRDTAEPPFDTAETAPPDTGTDTAAPPDAAVDTGDCTGRGRGHKGCR